MEMETRVNWFIYLLFVHILYKNKFNLIKTNPLKISLSRNIQQKSDFL